MDTTADPSVRAFHDDFRWDGVDLRPYKDDGAAPFKAISRQVLFADPALGCELRYFEMAAGGYSTLERHEHMHAVMILRGRGQVLLGGEVRAAAAVRSGHDPVLDLAPVPRHRRRALGFLCMVNAERDRPQLPTEAERAELANNPAVRAFLADGA